VGETLVALARRAMRGDRRALDDLLRELSPDIVRTARLVVGAGSWAAEDAAQEAMIDVIRGIQGLRDPDAVRSWALRVATARALKVARRERLLSLGRWKREVPELAATPVDSRLAVLKAAFDTLPARMRAAAVLRLHAGLSEAETAEALRCSVGTVKSQIHEARRRLTQSLRAEGLAPVTMPDATDRRTGTER
jgi:RNA polymerase sigma factor (sigma-70 family)